MLKARTALALALLLPALGAADPAKDRVKRFSSLASSKVVTERIEAIRELRTADDDRIVEALFKDVFQDEDFRVAEAGVAFLARTGTPEAFDWMKRNGGAHQDPRVRFYTLRTLESLPEPPSAKVLEPFARDSHWVIRLEAAAALARTPDEAAVPILKSMLSDASDPVRGSAILGLSDHKAVQHLPDIRKALLDKDWRVRSSALEAVETLKDYEAIPLLKEAHKQERELRMIDDLEQALHRMGVSLKAEIEEKKKEDERKARLLGDESSWVETGRHTGTVEYGPRLKDLKTLSRRIVYVMDCSKSMQDHVVEHPEPNPPPKGPGTGKSREYEVGAEGEAKKPKARSDEEVMGYERAKMIEKERNECFPPTKLGFVQREVCRAIRQLRSETSFNILCYQSAGKQKAWRSSYAQASPEMINKAVTFVKQQLPDGETATYDALVTALGFQEHDLFRQAANWDPKSWPDTVLLFSDGRPTEGLIIQEEPIESSVRRLYRVCRTRVHTVGVGREHLHLLEHIAQITGGRFVQIADIE